MSCSINVHALFAPTAANLSLCHVCYLQCRVKYDVTLCPVAGPQTACVSQRTGGSGRRLLATPADIAIFEGRTPFTT